jgi:hypothetical protein
MEANGPAIPSALIAETFGRTPLTELEPFKVATA